MSSVSWLIRSAILYLVFGLPVLNLCFAATHTVTVGDDNCNHGLSFVDSAGVCSNQSTVTVGDTINWTWGDNIMSHSTTSGTCVGPVCQATPFWNSGEFTTPYSFQRIFNNPGVFPYFCTVHDSEMTGTVRVLPAPASFALQPPIAVGSQPFAIVTGDFNGDGKLDLAVANRQSNSVTILLGVGNGTFIPAPGSPIGGFNGPNAIAVADFNNDGKLDLAVTNGADNLGSASVTILLGDGLGGFTVKGNLALGTFPQGITATDFDGDGKMDLAVTVTPLSGSLTASNVKVLLGNGDGTFGGVPSATLILSTNALSPTTLVAFDFNNDHKPDLAVTNSGSGANTFSIFLNTSSGPGAVNFASATNYNTGNTPHGITAGMFTDSQGRPVPGIAIPNYGNNTVGIFLADGAGIFSPVSGSPFTVGNTSAPSPIAVAAADFNGDGYLDLAVTNFNEATVTTLMNDAAGSFASFHTTLSEAASSPRDIAAGDFNGDGRPDLALAGFSKNDISVLLNGTAFPPAAPGLATHFGITVQSAGPPTPEGNPSTTAGVPFQITVTAYDAYQRIATGYTGTVHFDSSDPQALPSAGLPADYTFTSGTSLDNGVHVFTVTLKTADPAPLVQTIGVHDTGGDPAFNGRSSDILVNPGPASTFAVSAPASVFAGTPFTFTVTAMDAYGNVATGYSGTVHFSSSDTDSCKLLPVNSTLSNGTGTFTAKLISTGTQTLIVTDTITNSITGNATITVNPGTVHFIVTPSLTMVAVGQPFNLTVSAVDVCDNPQPTYTGTVHFTSTDGTAMLPVDHLFTVGASADNGTHTFTNGVTFFAAGQQTVTANDEFNQFFGTTSAVNVTTGATTITLGPLPQQFSFRKPITLTATVHVTAPAAGTPTGTVDFYDGAVKIGSCNLIDICTVSGTHATLTLSQWKIGRHSFTAVYNGDSNYQASPFSTPALIIYKSPKPH